MLENIHYVVLNIVFIILGISVALFIFNLGIGLSAYFGNKEKRTLESKELESEWNNWYNNRGWDWINKMHRCHDIWWLYWFWRLFRWGNRMW